MPAGFSQQATYCDVHLLMSEAVVSCRAFSPPTVQRIQQNTRASSRTTSYCAHDSSCILCTSSQVLEAQPLYICPSTNLRFFVAMPTRGRNGANVILEKFDRWETWIERCKCHLTWSENKKFIAKPHLHKPILPGERYPRCSECLKFYMDDDLVKRYTQEIEEETLHREEMMKSGHPLYQPGAKFAPRREKVGVIG